MRPVDAEPVANASWQAGPQSEAGPQSQYDFCEYECDIPLRADTSESEVEEYNLRILSCLDSFRDKASQQKGFFIGAEDRLPLLFFRRVFTILKAQSRKMQNAPEEGSDDGIDYILDDLRDDNSSDSEDDQPDQSIPIEAFQRAFERLFYILEVKKEGAEKEGQGWFNARSYDTNDNGWVGWTEFSAIFAEHNLVYRLSLPERIYLTFENPESSHCAQFVSIFVLLIIVLSSLCFILSTAPDFRKKPVGNVEPQPEDAFDVIENICLGIFVAEYVMRLCTCWAVRHELADKEKLLDLTVGNGSLDLSTPTMRFVLFLINPANIIDLVAILPGIVGWVGKVVSPGKPLLEGGAFVVLRLVRLTRIFRAFKNPKLVEPVIVIGRTMRNSTKALYLLAFNGLLGILISGSLMYLVEKGDWDPATRSYKRIVGEQWNKTTRVYEDVKEESPFYSIPHAFWWAVVTSTTVGYGDVGPVTSMGYVVATITMVVSLVMAALPVGVIGGNFSQVWDDFGKEKAKENARSEKDMKFIKMAMQKLNPFLMSRTVYIEVWNERLPHEPNSFTSTSQPNQAEFLGQAELMMDLDRERPVTKTRQLKIREGAQGMLTKRPVSGTITVQYDWTPKFYGPDDSSKSVTKIDGMPSLPLDRLNGHLPLDEATMLQGQLRLTLVSAEGLLNLTYQEGKYAGSNPYCRLFCYPNSPAASAPLIPIGWRSPGVKADVNPRWNKSKNFNFYWRDPGTIKLSPSKSKSPSRGGSEESDRGEANITQSLQSLVQELQSLREELAFLNGRVMRFTESPELPSPVS
jgi:hypothetical protein